MNNVKIFVSVVVVLILGIIATILIKPDTSSNLNSSGPGIYDQFAQCLKDQGAVFYGAFWCPHCKAQKKMFGSSEKLIPYVECSTLDGKGQTQECIEKGIKSYPTWEFIDGTQLNGQIPLAQLAEKTSCELPSNELEENGDDLNIGESSEAPVTP